MLQETICSGIVGGRLDFPRFASFASVKIVLWLEDEYFAAYSKHSGLLDLSEINDDGDDKDDDDKYSGCGGIVKSSDPEKFVLLATKTADSLLEHIHTLSQEALDHADLSVLTGIQKPLNFHVKFNVQNFTFHSYHRSRSLGKKFFVRVFAERHQDNVSTERRR